MPKPLLRFGGRRSSSERRAWGWASGAISRFPLPAAVLTLRPPASHRSLPRGNRAEPRAEQTEAADR